MSFDLNIMGDPDTLVTALSTDNTAIEGIVALAQRVMVLLFTDAEDPNNLGIGTSIPSYVNTVGNRPSNDALQNIFNIAVQTIRTDLIGYQSPDLPDDQKLQDLKVTIVTGERDAAFVELSIVSVAGDEYSIKYPVDDIYQGT